ncbi:MAG: ATP-binding protein [Polyangiaceae bacterium]|nr:ATP-binding protein [Polyangiaceae bacterium]
MRLSFNIAGPCIPGEHYMLPPERRLGRVMRLIEDRKYFTLHAGRQTGKTTSAQWLVQHLNGTGRWCAMHVDVQNARDTDSPFLTFKVIREDLDHAVLRDLPDVGLGSPQVRQVKPSRVFLMHYLRDLAARAPHPLVVLFDEADALMGKAMVSFLTQLRQGYIDRAKTPFPASVVLIGQRQVRDYAVRAKDQKPLSWLGTSSPFNITADATTIAPFTDADVEELLAQHTAATGQRFEPEAVARIYELGQGHPWLTNAMADQIVNWDVEDRSVAITAAHVDAAKETIILERRSHIDSLIAKLREERVRKIIDPMLAGDQTGVDVLDDDFAYVMGLGLVRRMGGQFVIANPIYREVIPRTLTYIRQGQIVPRRSYLRKDGSLDMAKLMVDWQKFWRKDGHVAAEGFGYRESGPHLMLMAFLQRIVNGGGRIDREYGLGRGALDLVVHWKKECHCIEIKIRRDRETEAEGLEQLAGYLDKLGLGEGWLVLFDLRESVSWQDKLFVREAEYAGKHIRIVGC